MENLTAEQANALANKFLGLSQAFGEYRFNNWDEISESENQMLGNLQWSILNSGEDMLALSTTLVMNDIQNSLGQIDSITVEIRSTIKNLGNIQKVINIAASIVTLCASIISKNPMGIVNTIEKVIEFLQT